MELFIEGGGGAKLTSICRFIGAEMVLMGFLGSICYLCRFIGARMVFMGFIGARMVYV